MNIKYILEEKESKNKIEKVLNIKDLESSFCFENYNIIERFLGSGLKDKNSNEIFENDIITYRSLEPEYNDHGFFGSEYMGFSINSFTSKVFYYKGAFFISHDIYGDECDEDEDGEYLNRIIDSDIFNWFDYKITIDEKTGLKNVEFEKLEDIREILLFIEYNEYGIENMSQFVDYLGVEINKNIDEEV